jgi:Carboxypeptidase regulatory-like domain
VREPRCRRLTFAVLLQAAVLLSTTGCRPGKPVIDTGPKPSRMDGTISGTVRGPQGGTPIEGRTVAVVNIATSERQETTTSNTGGFTFKVKPGKYSVEVTLRDGETVLKHPGVIDVSNSDVEAHADFIIAPTRVARPRFHAPRGDDGLGAGVA